MWLVGFVAGLVMVALAAAWLNGVGRPLAEDIAPAPAEPLVSAIDSPACRDRAVGAQYAMVCVDSQFLNTDDPAACDRFGGPYQIIVCPDPSQIVTGDTRPTIAASGGNIVLPLPPPAGTRSPSDPGAEGTPAVTPQAADRATPPADSPQQPPHEELPPQVRDMPGEPGRPQTPTPDLSQVPDPPTATPPPAPGEPPGDTQPLPTPTEAAIVTPPVTATPPQANGTPEGVTATPTLPVTPPAGPESTPTLTPAIELSPTPTPLPVITLPNEGYTLSGAGQQATPGLLLTSTRLLLVRLMYTGAGSVAVSARGADGSPGRLILQASGLPEKSGVIDIPAAGVYFIDVSTTSTAAWTLMVSQPVAPLQTPFTLPGTTLTGRGDQATTFVRFNSGAISIRLEHPAPGNFAVTLYDAETGRPVVSPLAQALGPVQQTVTVPIPRAGVYIFDVTAADTWSITIQ